MSCLDFRCLQNAWVGSFYSSMILCWAWLFGSLIFSIGFNSSTVTRGSWSDITLSCKGTLVFRCILKGLTSGGVLHKNFVTSGLMELAFLLVCGILAYQWLILFALSLFIWMVVWGRGTRFLFVVVCEYQTPIEKDKICMIMCWNTKESSWILVFQFATTEGQNGKVFQYLQYPF